MRIMPSILLSLALVIFPAVPAGAAPPAPAAGTGEISFNASALRILDESLAALNAAYGSDPQAAQVRDLRDATVRRLGELRERVAAIPPSAAPRLEAYLAAAPAPNLSALREAARAVALENRTWQLDMQSTPYQLFGLPLAPTDSRTVEVVSGIQRRVYDEITGPAAAIFLDEIKARLQNLATHWKDFYEHVTLQEYPWESAANAFFDRKRAITDIPIWQVKFLHPVSGVIAYQGRGSSSGAPLIGGEVLGVQWFDPGARYKPTWGVGVLATLRAEGERSHGFGLLGSYRDFKFGIRHSQLIDGRSLNQAIISINLARYFDFSPNSSLKRAVENLQTSAVP